MDKDQKENATNNIEAGMEKNCIKCRVFEFDDFLVLSMSSQIVNPDLQQVRKLQICKMTLTLNIG